MRTTLKLIKRPVNLVPRDELLLRDVTQMFWELRELREEIKVLKKENRYLKAGKAQIEKNNLKLRYENDLLSMSNMFK